MKVVYHFRTRGTGAEGVHIAGIANALAKLGYPVQFVSPTGIDPRQSAGANPFGGRKTKPSLLNRIASRCPDFVFELLELGYNIFAASKIRKALGTGDCAFIYERHAFFLCATAILARKRNIPIVIEVNELVGDQRIRKQPLLSPIARLTDKIAFRRAALITVVSPHLKRRIEQYGIPGEKILVIPNAVAAEEYATPHDGAEVRRKLNLTNNEVLIGFIGWFVEWHRLDLFLKVFARIHRDFPNTRLALVGDGKLKPELQAQIAAEKIESAVLFVDAVPHQEIPKHIAAFDIAVVPHSNEYRSPIKLFEYMAEAKASIAPATEPIKMIVQHERNGMLFEPLSEQQIYDCLAALVRDPQKRTQIGAQAREDILKKHTWLNNAEVILKNLKAGH